ncbi:unnamed protein product, partial [Pylaiella littoralis]
PLRVFFLSGRHQQLPFCLPRLLLGVPKDVNIMEAAAGEMDDRNGWTLRDSSGWRGDFGVRCG